MQGDAQVIDYLNKALLNELTAVNQYWLHYRMLDNWGVTRLAEYERHESIEEVLKGDLALEQEAMPLLKEAIAHCETVRDYISREILEDILEGEEEHVDFLETQFDLIKNMGLQNYVQLQSKPAED